MKLGGLTVLERKLCEAEHSGATRALVACSGPLPERALSIEVERVAADSEPPQDAEIVRADEVAGVRIESREDCARAEWRHMQQLPKSFQGPVDALFNRHFSLRITRLLAHTPVTPNQITIVALLIGLAAALLLVIGTSAAVIGAGGLIVLQSIVDSCDGELARLRFQFSALGQWLDNVADDVVDSALMVALGVAAGGEVWLVLGICAGAARVFTQLVLYWQVTRVGGQFWNFRWWFESEVESVDEVYDPTSPLTWVRSLGRRDVYLFIWGGLCVGQVPGVAAGYGVGISAVFTTMTLIHLVVSRTRGQAGG